MTKVSIAEDVAEQIRSSEGPIELVDANGQTIGVVRRPPTVAEIERARSRVSRDGKPPFLGPSGCEGQGRSGRVIYDVGFSLDAATELLRITEVVGSAVPVLQAAEAIRRQLEVDPAEKGFVLYRRGTFACVLPDRR